jgi:hypothetical protein
MAGKIVARIVNTAPVARQRRNDVPISERGSLGQSFIPSRTKPKKTTDR